MEVESTMFGELVLVVWEMVSSPDLTAGCNVSYSAVIASLFSPLLVVLLDSFVLCGVITKFDIMSSVVLSL